MLTWQNSRASRRLTEFRATPFHFHSSGATLTGTLERAEPARGRSVLLLSGSGPQDRDETIANQKPFLELSRALVNAGHTVIRWDDRGVGESTGDYLAASESILVDDVAAALGRATEITGRDQHVLVGHSQGTLIAAAAANRCPDAVEGVALLAGMGLAGRAGLARQFRRIYLAEGWPEAQLDDALAQRSALFDVLETLDDRIAAGEPAGEVELAVRSSLLDILAGGTPASDLAPGDLDELMLVVDDLMEWEWRFLLRTDPAKNLRQLSCPVLAMTGSTDLQVDATADLEAIKAACVKAASVEVVSLPNHNHLFQETSSGALSDYADLGRPFSDASIAVLQRWLQRI